MSDRAFVFVWLPGETGPALAGQVIVVATGNGGFCRFKYASEYLAHPDAFALDPRALPLADTVFESEPDFELFSVFRDAGPDHFGRKVIERRLDRHDLGELDYILEVGDHRVGALGFSMSRALAPAAARPAVSHRRLDDLVAAVHDLDSDAPIDPELLALLGEGTGSLGGMRPKATVADDGGLWVAKMPTRDDRLDFVRLEFVALRLAARAGIDVPEHRLETVGGHPVLLTRRFDRAPLGEDQLLRHHYLSGLTMTGLHERDHGQGRYADLVDWLRQHGADPATDGRALFRRMVFNVLVGNTDDHLRNHAVIRREEGYRLSPAFDLVPQPARTDSRFQAIGIGVRGRESTVENALSEAARFGLDPAPAREIVDEVRNAVAGWREDAEACGLDAAALGAMARAVRVGGA